MAGNLSQSFQKLSYRLVQNTDKFVHDTNTYVNETNANVSAT